MFRVGFYKWVACVSVSKAIQAAHHDLHLWPGDYETGSDEFFCFRSTPGFTTGFPGATFCPVQLERAISNICRNPFSSCCTLHGSI